MNGIYNKILEIKFIPKFIKILVIIGINWIFQSLFYMEKIEKTFKLALDFILLLIFYVVIGQFFAFFMAIFISFFLAHTINWAFNGHIFALLKTFNIVKTEPTKFVRYIDGLTKRAKREKGILLVAAFGSLSRKELKETSDLDIRIIGKSGLNNGLRVCLFAMLERSRAFLNKFPLDIYVAKNFTNLSRLTEKPIELYRFS